MNKATLFGFRGVIQVGLVAMWAVLSSAYGAETILDKRLPSGNRVAVVLEQRAAEEVAAWEHEQFGWPIIAPTHLCVRLHTPERPQGVVVWTNRYFRMETYEYSLTNHTAYDICEIGTNLWLCYKQGPSLFCEQVWGRAAGAPRERFALERDWYPYRVVTNAVFSVDTNGVPILTGYENKGAVLVWRYQDPDWNLDLAASRPESKAERAYRAWWKARYEGGFQWSVVRKNPPLPRQSKP